MRLLSLRAALSAAEFRPHTLTLGWGAHLATALPPAAAAFVEDRSDSPMPMSVAERWDTETIEEYAGLDEEDRMAVLAYCGFLNHELAHRVDFLSTPFGVAFHGKACLETIGLLLEGAELISELERRDPSRPLRDIPPVPDKLVVSDGLETLNARIRWFDSLRGAAPKHVKPGWMSDPDVLSLGDAQLDIVMVHELVPTLSVPGSNGAYVRPLTILESRAVALTGLLLLNRLGADDYAAKEVALFLETLYTPREAFPDYRFLLDLFLRIAGRDDLSSLADEAGVLGLTGLLQVISVIGWYGLHATPETNPEEPLNASPMLRVIVAIQDLLGRTHEGDKALEAVRFLDGIDRGENAARLGLADSRATLRYSLEYLRFVRRYNLTVNPHPELLAHFDRTLSLQEDQIERRLEHGYRFAAGIPNDGSVLAGFAAPEVDERLFFDEEPVADEVSDWFRVREMLLFRRARPPGFWPELWSIVGTHPRASGLDHNAARGLALARARFVVGGIWPTHVIVAPIGDGEGLPCVPVRRTSLPKTFAAATELDLGASWTVLVTPGESLVALKVVFPGN
jgi:hypothetical protein